MKKDESIEFRYKNFKLFNFISFLCFILIMIVIFFILKSDLSTGFKIVYVLLTFIIVNVFLILINKFVINKKVKFTYTKNQLIYETLTNEYTISYDEIESITKELYIDESGLLKVENYLYRVKIKDSGYFCFRYCDESTSEAIKILAHKSKIIIDELF